MKTLNNLNNKKLAKLEQRLLDKILDYGVVNLEKLPIADMRKLKRLIRLHKKFVTARGDFLAIMELVFLINKIDHWINKRIESDSNGKVVSINKGRK